MALPTIAIGIDFSEGSRRAVQAVSTLARGASPAVVVPAAFGRKGQASMGFGPAGTG